MEFLDKMFVLYDSQIYLKLVVSSHRQETTEQSHSVERKAVC